MSENAIVLSEVRAFSKEIAISQLLPPALKNKPADVLAIVLTGKELGLEPMQAIRGIHIINGKTSLSADLMGALVKRSTACEFLQLRESSAKIATYATKRKGDPGETVMSFTIEQAKAAGVMGNPTWQKYPDAMLRARALAAICRAVYPDLCLGLYDSDSGELAEPAERDVTPLKDHAAGVAAAVQAAVKPAAEVVDGEVITEKTEGVGTFAFITERIALAKTLAELGAIAPEIKGLTADAKTALRPIYMARAAELKEAK